MLEKKITYKNHLSKEATDATHWAQLICDPYIRPLQRSYSSTLGSDPSTLELAKRIVEADLGPILGAHYVGREDFWVSNGHCLEHGKSRVSIGYTIVNPNKGKRGEPSELSFTHFVWLADWFDRSNPQTKED